MRADAVLEAMVDGADLKRCLHRPERALARRLASLLFTEDTRRSAADPVAPAQRSPQAAAKAASARAPDGQVAHSLEDLLSDLGTLCRNEVRIGEGKHTFPRLTTATELQARAFELLAIKPN